MPQSEEITAILINSKSGGDATRKIFYYLKAENPRYSMAYVTRHTSIKSRGYVSEVLAGKKLLKLSFVDDLIELFKLSPAQAKVLSLLWQVDHVDDSSYKHDLLQELAKARRVLSVKSSVAPAAMSDMLTILEVYSYLNILKKPTPIREVVDRFSSYPRHAIESALGNLIRGGFATQEEGCVTTTQESFYFTDSIDGNAHLNFLRQTILQAADGAEKWFDQNHVSHFESTIITANKKQLASALPEIRRVLLSIQEEIDSDEPDLLLRFNIQMYPSLEG